MVSVRKVVSPGRGRPGMTSGAWARSMVWMPDSMERSIGSFSEPARLVIMILGARAEAGALFREALVLLPLFLLTAFFCLGMVLLQQRRYRLEKFLDLDRFVQNSYIIFLCVLCRFRAG